MSLCWKVRVETDRRTDAIALPPVLVRLVKILATPVNYNYYLSMNIAAGDAVKRFYIIRQLVGRQQKKQKNTQRHTAWTKTSYSYVSNTDLGLIKAQHASLCSLMTTEPLTVIIITAI